jgi:polyphosphate glucokinase
MTATQMVELAKQAAADWSYDVVSLGFPGPVAHNAPVQEPVNLGLGWVGFDFGAAFDRPVRIINDAAMQALGSDQGGRMLFLGLGTGLGSAMVVDGRVEPLELAHLPYKDNGTYEDHVGRRALKRLGKRKWRREVATVIAALTAALRPDYVVLGGGNTKYLDQLPPGTRLGRNANAFVGGLRLWSHEPLARARGDVRILDDAAAFDRAAADIFLDAARAAVAHHGQFRVALSGGSTPRGMNALLDDRVPWASTHVFWGDERHVPSDHPDSNYRSASETLLSRVHIPTANVHRVPTELPSAAAAANAYEAELRRYFDSDQPHFDLIVLGMGDDGHTASLFPATAALAETQRWVIGNWVGKLFAERITFTLPVLNNAARVLILVAGANKARPLKAVLDGPFAPQQLPAQLIQPGHGELTWLVDRPAAQLLDA